MVLQSSAYAAGSAFVVAVGSCAALLATPAFGQAAASRTAPESLLPPAAARSSEIVLPQTRTNEAPAGSADIDVTVSSVAISGGSPEFKPAIDAATAAITNKPVKVADLYAAASRIEAAYARAGYVLTRVTLPPQHIGDGGKLTIMIIDGFVEAIDDSGVQRHVRAAVHKRAAKLIGIHRLTLAQIERHVLLASEIPGVTMRSTLVPGSAVGATRLVLSADWNPVSVAITAENNLGTVYGNLAFSAQVSFNDLLGQGELLYAQATSGRDLGHAFHGAPLRRIVGGGAVLPIGGNGLALSSEYVHVDTNPATAPGATAVRSRFERVALRLQYPLIHSQSRSLDLVGGIDLVSESSQASAFAQRLNQDRLRVAVGQIRWSGRIDGKTALASELTFNHGLSGLGARTLDDATASGIPLSRLGATPGFSKLGAKLRIDRQLGQGFAVAGVVRGQTSFSGALPASAMFSLDGAESLSGFVQGSLSVDRGIVLRGELTRTFALGPKRAAAITPYGFGAYGTGKLSQPTTLELAAATRNAWSFGAGARLVVRPGPARIVSFGGIEISRNHDSTAPRDTTRVTASLTIRV